MKPSKAKRGAPPPRGVWRKISPPRVWEPEIGDQIVGHFLDFEQHGGCHGSFQVSRILTSEGILYRGGALLGRLLKDPSITPGSEGTLICVTYLGRPKRFHEFEVHIYDEDPS